MVKLASHGQTCTMLCGEMHAHNLLHCCLSQARCLPRHGSQWRARGLPARWSFVSLGHTPTVCCMGLSHPVSSAASCRWVVHLAGSRVGHRAGSVQGRRKGGMCCVTDVYLHTHSRQHGYSRPSLQPPAPRHTNRTRKQPTASALTLNRFLLV